MKTAVAGVTIILLFASFPLAGRAEMGPVPVQQAQPAADLNAILSQIQQVSTSTNSNITRLRIEKWKTDAEQKKQLQQIADSLQKNISNAVPGLITDVQTSKGSVVTSFKLYHNLNVLYEFLSGLADAAGSLSKKDEYEPLAADAVALDTARQNLSAYIEQAANRLESANRAGTDPMTQARQGATPVPGKKVVVIDEDENKPKKPAKPATKPTKKKTSAPSPATPAPSSTTPH
ncbi:MAG TPA: hypothetical protein VE133_04535 [Candidatus Sulfotelmatobacter sp.]|jgi:uncharacterized protein YbcI|nr:hypothetical protein [Candidatus Sulfotelmatobacter sp.]